MGRTLILLLVLVLSALSLATSRHQARMLYVELERERQIARQYEEEYGRLQIEQSTWAVPTRIDSLARGKLGMQLPDPARIRVVDYHETPPSVSQEAR